MSDEFWERKLMAFLHDPPNKPLDIPGHKEVSWSFLKRAGIDPEDMKKFSPICDHTAAAADRFPFPHPRKLKSTFTGSRDDETPFRHPLGGSAFFFDQALPSAEFAEEIFQSCQPAGSQELTQLPAEDRAWARFFLHWRLWAENAAARDPRTLFLPADTRLPDHNVWSHNSVVAALQGCVIDSRLEAAFLLFQLGPVQEFIQQARSTRDLWSGSYLLSWLMAHAIKAVTDRVGPDTVIFPAMRDQPIFDLLHRDRLYNKIRYASGTEKEESLWDRLRQPTFDDTALSNRAGKSKRPYSDQHREFRPDEDILTPSLPNRFLALVPAAKAQELAKTAESAIQSELGRIAKACRIWLDQRKATLEETWILRFDNQIRAFPKIAWQVCPWGDQSIQETLQEFESLAHGEDANLKAIHRLATEAIPREQRDRRYFKDPEQRELNNRGFCWSNYYFLVDWLLAARRRTRDFEPWKTDDHQEDYPKDSFSGIEEVIGDKSYWENLTETRDLGHLFRSQDRLGAINLVKRIWHRAYLEKEYQLQVEPALRFGSVPGVAAGQWRDRLLREARDHPETRQALMGVLTQLKSHQEAARTLGFVISSASGERQWLEGTDPGVFAPSVWEQSDAVEESVCRQVTASLKKFYRDTRISPPPAYYAVLVFDGDHMGEWVSGKRTPLLFDQFSKGAREYFQDVLSEEQRGTVRRPLSPSYHLGFSEALANFGLHLARPIVEHFGGQLIYSGGDDVLAMLPAGTVLDCAETLWLAFRGDQQGVKKSGGIFEVLGDKGGFVRLSGRTGFRLPTWPLVVPGPGAQASVGVAVGHIRSPLQGLVRAAREAEKRAKEEPESGGLGRESCAVSLFKRSGEIIHWGFKWDSRALPLYRRFCDLSQAANGAVPALSGRFSYALRALLAPYAPPAFREAPVLSPVQDLDQRAVIRHELQHVLGRQGENLKSQERQVFQRLCEEWLDDLAKNLTEPGSSLYHNFPQLFDVAHFIQRGE